MASKIVKLTTPWKLPYLDQSPGGKGVWGDYQFHINDDCDEADYWVVWGWEEPAGQRVRVPKEHVVYLTDEAHEQRFYHPGYLAQFAQVASPRKDLPIPNLVRHHEFAPWYLPMSWDELADMAPPAKDPGSFSAISSSLVHLEGHLKRFAFLNQLRGHFKDRLSVFGRGIRPVEDKREAFFPYQYTLALENSAIPDYFTEKVREVWLGYGFPFYWGCPNLHEYFDGDSFVYVDVHDFKASIEVIEHAIAHDFFGQRQDLIRDSRHKVLYEYHLFPALAKLLDTLPADTTSENRVLTPEKTFWQRDQSAARRTVHAVLRKLRGFRP